MSSAHSFWSASLLPHFAFELFVFAEGKSKRFVLLISGTKPDPSFEPAQS
jgi:hypothetical protein